VGIRDCFWKFFEFGCKNWKLPLGCGGAKKNWFVGIWGFWGFGGKKMIGAWKVAGRSKDIMFLSFLLNGARCLAWNRASLPKFF
jgi:hypothetical protein